MDTVLEQGLAALREDMRHQAEAASQRQEALLAELARMQRKQEQHAAYSRLRNTLRRLYGLVYALYGVTTDVRNLQRWPAWSHFDQNERIFGDIPFPFPSVSFSSLGDGLTGQARSAVSVLSQPQQYVHGQPHQYAQGYSTQAENAHSACSGYVKRFKEWYRDCEASLQAVQEHVALVTRDLDIVAGASGPSGARAAGAAASTGERRERERVSPQGVAAASASRPSVASGASAPAPSAVEADSVFVVQLGSFRELDAATFCGLVRSPLLARVREVEAKIQHLSQPVTEVLKQFELARETLSSKEDPQTRLRNFGAQAAALEVSWKSLGDEVQTIWTGTPPVQELFVRILRTPDPVF